MTGRVLIVVSGADRILLANDKYYRTGFWLSELAEPLKHFYDADMDPEFASPGGRKPSVDPNSLKMVAPGKQGEYHELVRLIEGLWAPAPLESLELPELEKYAAIFLAGGHAPMVDLRGNPDLGRILLHFHANDKPTIAIGHGPVGLLSAVAPDGSWPYEGYRMTCYSNMGEQIVEHLGQVSGPLPYYVADELGRRGAIVKNRVLAFFPNVVRDRELLTGQDMFAASKLGEEAVKMIKSWIGLQTPYLDKPYPW
jgi:putative intracellular protease/amidase